jgi:hypothetical protein
MTPSARKWSANRSIVSAAFSFEAKKEQKIGQKEWRLFLKLVQKVNASSLSFPFILKEQRELSPALENKGPSS